MPWKSKPRVPDLDDEPHFRWPAWLIGLDQEALFGHLHERFNTVPFFIQDPESFHHDVFELTVLARDREHFYQLIQQRKEQRLQELREAFRRIVTKLGTGYSQLSSNQDFRLIRLSRLASYDCLVKFLESLSCPDKAGREPFPGVDPRAVVPFPKEHSAQQEQRPLPSPQHTSSPESNPKRTTNLRSSTPNDLTPTQEIHSLAASSQRVTSAKRKRDQYTDDEGAGTKSRRSGERREMKLEVDDTLEKVETMDAAAAGVLHTQPATYGNITRTKRRRGGGIPLSHILAENSSEASERTAAKEAVPETTLAPPVDEDTDITSGSRSMSTNSGQRVGRQGKQGISKRIFERRRNPPHAQG